MATVPSVPSVATLAKVTATWGNLVQAFAAFHNTGKPITYLTQSVAQSIPNGAYTGISFTAAGDEQIDRDGQHSPSTNPSRIVIGNTLGWYLVFGSYVPTASAAGSTRRAQICLNGASAFGETAVATNAQQTTLFTASLIPAGVSTDYVEIRVWQDTGGAQNTVVSGGLRSTLGAIWLSS